MAGVPHPVLFVVGGVLLVGVVVLFVWALARMAALADAAELESLSVPAGAADARVVAPVPSSPLGRGRWGGQRVDRAAAQERAARDALRCAGARVDVAPVRCPLDEVRG